jgi:ankyrin repeat protein
VKILLQRNDVVADSLVTRWLNKGRTPLSFAAEKGHESIVKILLQRNDIVADTIATGQKHEG